jgi:ribonuclease HI/probable phosphoglycerate mutase
LTADSQVDFFLDSLLVVNQLKGKFKIKERKLRELAGEVKRLEREVGMEGDYVYIPRKENHLADKLVNQVLDKL